MSSSRAQQSAVLHIIHALEEEWKASECCTRYDGNDVEWLNMAKKYQKKAILNWLQAAVCLFSWIQGE